MTNYVLDFESPLRDIEIKIDSLKSTAIKTGMDVSEGIKKLEDELSNKRKNIYDNLSRWERVQLARHPNRPYSSDFIMRITNYWFELHGDRGFADDNSMVCGIGLIDNLKVMIISQEKGRGTKFFEASELRVCFFRLWGIIDARILFFLDDSSNKR